MLKFTPRNLQLARSEYVHGHYTFKVTAGLPFSAVMSPDYWAHVAEALRLHDVLRMIAEDGSFDVELTVIGFVTTEDKKRKVGAKVRLKNLPPKTLAPPEQESADGYQIKFAGRAKWRVLDPSGTVVSEGLETKEDAETARDKFMLAKAA